MELGDRVRLLAERVAQIVEPASCVGLGSGSTAEAVVRALGSRVHEGLDFEGIATSHATEKLARSLGIRLKSIDDVQWLDLGVDGADEIDSDLNLTKGRGGALLFEKLVAQTCRRFIVVATAEKLVDDLGMGVPLPVEVVPFGWRHTAESLQELGLKPILRQVKSARGSAPFRTEGGHLILDCHTGRIADPYSLASRIKSISGVVEHGLFIGMATSAYIVQADGTINEITSAARQATRGSTLG